MRPLWLLHNNKLRSVLLKRCTSFIIDNNKGKKIINLISRGFSPLFPHVVSFFQTSQRMRFSARVNRYFPSRMTVDYHPKLWKEKKRHRSSPFCLFLPFQIEANQDMRRWDSSQGQKLTRDNSKEEKIPKEDTIACYLMARRMGGSAEQSQNRMHPTKR